MKIRARYIHLSEGVIDTILGLCIAPVISYYYWTDLGYEIQLPEQLRLTVILLVLGIARKFVVRRGGNKVIKRIYSE